ncbi:MAG: PEP-CTERM sorting domain-containing protein [Massilia sp.]
MAFAANAKAGAISDVGSNNYWGGNDHGYGDVIGTSMYDVSGALVTLVGNTLTVRITTNFAGHAGADTWAETNGIGYGDVFLASAWNPAGVDAHHTSDNATTGTHWSYGLNLDNRWSNTGGTFTLYELNGVTNGSNILNSQSFLSCALGSQCYYRDGQATAVKTTSSTVRNTGLTGQWSVENNVGLLLTINIANTALASYSNMALHWGETCQNDVIEGVTKVPEPATMALFALGLLALGLRRKA